MPPMNAEALPNLPPKPERPLDGDCCDNGCEVCVFTAYAEDLRRWQEAVIAITAEARAATADADIRK